MVDDIDFYDYKLIAYDEFDNNYVFVKDKESVLLNLQHLMRMYIRHTIVFPIGWRNRPIYYNEFVKSVNLYLQQNPKFGSVFKLSRFLTSMDYYIENIMYYMSKNLKKMQYDYEIFPPRKKICGCIPKRINYTKICPVCFEEDRKIQRFMYEGEYYVKILPCDHIVCESPCYTNILASKKIKFDPKKYSLASIDFKNHYPIECIVCKTKIRKALYKSDNAFNYYLREVINDYTIKIDYT
jgi:hypothetical protein